MAGAHPSGIELSGAADQPRPTLVVIGLAFVTTLAGHFTLDRLGLTIPVLNDSRVLLFSAVVMSFVLEATAASRRAGSRVTRLGAALGTRRCLHPVLVLFGYQMLSASWAPPGAVINDVLTDLVAETVLVCVYAALAEWDGDRVIRITLTSLYGAAWLYFLYAASGRGHTASGRWAAFGGGPNVFVRVMILGMLAAVYLYCRDGDRLIWLIGVPPFLVGALGSGSRGGLTALGITAGVALPRLWRILGTRRFIRPLVLFAVMCAALWSVFGPTVVALSQNRLAVATLKEHYTSGRDVLYEKGLEVFYEHPVLGVGVHGFSVSANVGSAGIYVHNLPLAVAAEGGVVGVMLLIAAFIALRREYARVPYRRRSLEARTAASCGILIGCAGLFSGDYYDSRLMWIFFLLAAVRPPSDQRQESSSPRTEPSIRY
ncbi:O-antigen ligase family protein [Actinoplanes sp. CA-030573]|uniref:O-antigen ligase family protein n=1 Tax=Actinoplanes sp. CA-030573 TaxID=3239898 RepID=UPI003D8DF943